MKAIVFALWMLFVCDPYSGQQMEVPFEVSLSAYSEAVAMGVDPAVMGGLMMHEHPGGGPDKFLPPFKESSAGAVGLWQLRWVWFDKARDDWGYDDLTWDEFSQDGDLQTGIAVRVVERMTRKHTAHAKEGEHPLFAHWSCGNSARDDGVSWEGEDLPQCASSVARVERRIEHVRPWRFVALPLAGLDALRQVGGWLTSSAASPDA